MKEEVEDLADLEDILMEEGKEIVMARSRIRNNGGKTATLVENQTVEFPIMFPRSSLTQVVFLSLALWEKWKLRELYAI